MEGFTDDMFDVFTSLPQKRSQQFSDEAPAKKQQNDSIDIQSLEISDDSDVEIVQDYYVTQEDLQGCIHEAVYPNNYVNKPIPNRPPAKSYPFNLDPFQQCAIRCLDAKQSVLVAAHTSAGKTAVAEYAIASALRDKQKVIYTSPIKALSNQKYRELSDEFKDVGLMTGDVTINEEASCLVMTTEILRSMLYRGSEVVREMAWVIFDEIHYMRDKERGVVWEETIIMLPEPVKLVFLSATIPNAREFAEWICKIKTQPCHVVYTEMRPVPLQHYVFPAGGDGIYLVVDETGTFKEQNFQKAISCLIDSGNEIRPKKKIAHGANSEVVKVIHLIMERNFSPAIVFSFSKKDCEAHAISLNKCDFTTDDEKGNIEEIFNNAISTLSEEDRALPMFENMLPMLKRGIGIHHGGLLPIIKEVTEILFQEGFIKVLFSTETFSMGLNMPARTVVFTNVRKFDGSNFRWLGGGEYIQMSGRAGRRGIDDRGICILMVDQKMEPEVAKSMLKGNMDPLNSTFHLNYNMLLNLMRMEEARPEDMIKKSFHQFQNDRAAPEIYRRKKELKNQLREMIIEKEAELEELKQIEMSKNAYKQTIQGFIQKNENILRFMTPGRLVRVVDNGTDWGWGIVVNFIKKRIDKKSLKDLSEKTPDKFVIDVVLYVKLQEKPYPLPNLMSEEGEMTVIPMYTECIETVSSIQTYLPADIKSREALRNLKSTLREIMNRVNFKPPLLDPIKHMGINDPEFLKAQERYTQLEAREQSLTVTHRPDFSQLKDRYEEKKKILAGITLLNNQLKASKTMVLSDDWKAMRRVLRRLGFCSEQLVELKGRVACEISTSDELLTTELMLSGVFKDLPTDVMVALLSCLVFEENSRESKPPGAPELAAAFQLLRTTATRFAQVFVQSKLNIDQEAYINSYKPGLMEVVYAWAHGAKFSEVCELSNEIYEGVIIRCIRRLHELLRQLRDASKAISSHDLATKFDESIRLIERGIVFAASLYL